MELLVIGIDGGTKEIIDGMPMPFTQSLFREANSKMLEEDLLSRGWAEALTGCHASENNSFYAMPFLDGSYDFNRAYTKKEMIEESSNLPIWSALNKKGVDVGILNVPTTGPADCVDGFIVSGGGGGLNSIGGLPKDMYYPERIEKTLLKNNYIFDIRLPGKTKTISEFINKISSAEILQKNTFLDLVSQENPSFGFHCIRMITEIQYLARYEIEMCIEGIKEAKIKGESFEPKNSVQTTLLEYYQQVDKNIQEIFETLHPKSFMFIGDHSTSMFEKDLNLDVWLEKKGYLKLCNKLERFHMRVKNSEKISKYLDKYKIKKKPVRKPARKTATKFKSSKTLAFGTFFEVGNIAGLFVNDKKRFGGPVDSAEGVNSLVSGICAEFNSDSEVQKYNLKAEPYREKFKGSKYFDYIPDIKISKPDTIYCSGRKWSFISDNPNLKPFSESLEGIRYPYTGLKGSDPLFVYSKNLETYIHENDPNDLRLTYNIINRYFDENKGKEV